jgi:TP901 family phage tail tape measure protein
MATDLDLKLNITADNKDSNAALEQTTASLKDVEQATVDTGNAAESSNKSFSAFAISSIPLLKQIGEIAKNITLAEFKQDIQSAVVSLALFAANTAATFTSLKKNIASESAFSEASRTINATDDQLKELKTTIDTMATVDLAIPTEQLYAIAKAAGSAGKSAQDIPQFVRTVAEGVVALGIPAEELANKLGTVQALLHLSEDQLVSFSDQVNTTADTLANVSETDIFEVMATGAASAGQQFGLLKGETIALSGTMVSLGAAPEVARTGIINLLNSLQNAKNQTPEFQQALAMMGTSADKLAVDIKAKPMPTLLALLDTMYSFSKVGRLDLADKLLGKGQDSVALTKLVDNTQLLKEAINQTSDATIYSGSVRDAYLKKLATEDSGLTLLKNSWNSFSLSLTDTFLPAIKLITNAFTKLLNVFTDLSINHPIIKTFGAITAVVISLGGAFRLLGLAMSLVGLAPAGLMTKFAQLGGVLISLNANVMATTASLFAMARGASAFGILKTAMSFLVGGTLGLAVGAIAAVGLAIANVLPMTTKWGETTATVGEVIGAMWKTIIEGFQPIAEVFSQGKTALDEWLKSLGIAEGLTGALKNSLEFIGVVVVNTGGLFKAFGQSIGAVVGYAVESIAAFSQFTEDVFSGKGIGNSLNTYLDRVKNNVAQVSNSFKQIGEDSKNAVKTFEETTAKNLQKDPKTLAQKDTRAADTGTDPTTGEPVDTKTAAKAQDDLAKSVRDREIQQIRDNEAEKIRLYTSTAVTKKQIDDFSFQQKINTENQIGLLTKQRLNAELADLTQESTAKHQFTQDELLAKRTTLIEIETATANQIKNLVALEKDHRDKAIGFIKEIEGIEQARLGTLQALDQQGLSSSELSELKKRQLTTDTAKIKQLIADGEFTAAAELGKKTIDLAKQIATAEATENEKTGWNFTNAKNARETYNKTVDLTKSALEQAAAAETKQADIAKAEADKRVLTLDQVRARIADIETAVKNGTELKITANTVVVDDAIARIKQPTQSTHTINVVENRGGSTQPAEPIQARQDGGIIGVLRRAAGGAIQRAGGALAGYGGGDRRLLLAEDGEYVTDKDTTRREGVEAFDALKKGDATIVLRSEGGVIGDYKAKAAELKKKKFEEVSAFFDQPFTQLSWTHGGQGQAYQSEDAARLSFEMNAEKYLRDNALPLEFLSDYMKNLKLSKDLTNAVGFDAKAKAQLALDDAQAKADTVPISQTNQNSVTSSAQLPSFSTTTASSSVSPPMRLPTVSSGNLSIGNSAALQTAGKVSTIKFVAPSGQSVSGQFNGSNPEDFFSKLDTISGVTKL